MKKYLISALSVLLILICLDGCGSTNVNVLVTRPAEYNMLKYKKLIVTEFEGYKGNTLNNEVINALVDLNKFEIIDRNYLTKVLNDNGLTYEGILSNGMTSQVGDKVGTVALISGKLTKHEFNEEVKKGAADKDSKNVNHYTYTMYGHTFVSIYFQITDLNTGKIIFSKNIDRKIDDSKDKVDREPDHYNKDYMLEQARGLTIQDFIRKIVPYTETISVELFDDSDVPDYEKGIKYAKNGFWDKAILAFQDGIMIAKNNELKAKGYYNLGIAYQYSYMFTDASKSFDKAFSLDDKDTYMTAIKNCKQMEAEYRVVNEQLKK